MNKQTTLNDIKQKSQKLKNETTNKGLPNDWNKKRADELITITRGASPRPKGDPELFGGDIPWIKIGDVDVKDQRWTADTSDTVTEEGAKKSKLVDKGTLLVSNSGTCGYPVFVGKESCVHDGWLILRDYEESFNPHYLYEFILYKQNFLESLAPGSTQINLNTSRFGVLEINKPPLPEQRKIATVLYNVDQAIQKTEEIIEQTKRVKKGLMQDLFTEGYFEHETVEGDSRWKRIPKEWDLIPLNEIVTTNPRYEKPDKEIAYIEMDAVNEDLPYPDYIGRRNPQNSSGRIFAEKDTLFARITPCTENGKICFVNKINTGLGIASTELAVLSPDSDKILSKFLYHYTRTYTVRDYAISRMRGSTGRQRVPFSVFKKELKIPLPKKNEQRKIIEVLDNIDNKKTNLRKHKRQLTRFKKGLMQDLLKGKVRTQDKDIEVLNEVKEVETHGEDT